MTPQTAALICSIIGALLFFCGGFLLAKLRADSGIDDLETKGRPTMDVPSRSDENETLKARAASASRERDRVIRENRNLKREIENVKQKADAYFADAKHRFSKLKDQLAAERAAAADLKSREKALDASAPQEIERLKNNNARLSRALEQARQDLAAKTEIVSNLKIVTAQFKEENSSLKSQCEGLMTLKDEVAALKRENNRYRARGIVLNEPFKHNIASSADGLGGAFQYVANELSKMRGARDVVLADELGLLVAGVGDHMEAMAGAAALFSNVGLKLEGMLPFGQINALTITNTQDLTITLQPFVVGSDTLIVATLTVGEGPSRSAIDTLMAKAVESGRS